MSSNDECKKNLFINKKGSGVLFDFKSKNSLTNDKSEKVKSMINENKKQLIFIEKTDWMFNKKNFDIAFLERYKIVKNRVDSRIESGSNTFFFKK